MSTRERLDPVPPDARHGAPWTCPSWQQLKIESHEFYLRAFTFSTEGVGDLRAAFEIEDAWDLPWSVEFPTVRHLFMKTELDVADQAVEADAFEHPQMIGSTSRQLDVADSIEKGGEIESSAWQGDIFFMGIGSGGVSFLAAEAWVEQRSLAESAIPWVVDHGLAQGEGLDPSRSREPWSCRPWREVGLESRRCFLRSFTVRIEGSGDIGIDIVVEDPSGKRWLLAFAKVGHVEMDTVVLFPGKDTEPQEILGTVRDDDYFELALGDGKIMFRAAEARVIPGSSAPSR